MLGHGRAHRAGIVHRDLKPNNLFVDRQGQRPVLKVLDFGISKVTSDVAHSMTATATAFGTPLYMSPEQVRSAKNVDGGRADIWSLGVVLYELLTGESPFLAESATAILAAIIADAPVPVAERRPDLPRPLADAVMRALEKNPAARFPDVRSFAAALAPFGPGGDAAVLTSSVAPPAPGQAAASAATHVPPLKGMPRPARGGLPVAPIAMGMVLALAAGGVLFMTIGKRPPSSGGARRAHRARGRERARARAGGRPRRHRVAGGGGVGPHAVRARRRSSPTPSRSRPRLDRARRPILRRPCPRRPVLRRPCRSPTPRPRHLWSPHAPLMELEP